MEWLFFKTSNLTWFESWELNCLFVFTVDFPPTSLKWILIAWFGFRQFKKKCKGKNYNRRETLAFAESVCQLHGNFRDLHDLCTARLIAWQTDLNTIAGSSSSFYAAFCEHLFHIYTNDFKFVCLQWKRGTKRVCFG